MPPCRELLSVRICFFAQFSANVSQMDIFFSLGQVRHDLNGWDAVLDGKFRFNKSRPSVKYTWKLKKKVIDYDQVFAYRDRKLCFARTHQTFG